MLAGDLGLFVLGVAGQRNDLHPVQKRPGHVVAVRRGQEHHVRQVIFDLKVVIDESRILFRVQHLQERRGRIAAEIMPHLVDFIEQDQRVGGLRLFQRLNDLARHRADIGAPVAADFALIAHAAKADADEFPPRGAGDRAAQRGLADARRADKAQDRPLELVRARLHGEIFDDAFLDLFEPVVIGIEHLFGAEQILFHPALHAPRQIEQPVQIVAHHRRFRRHRAHRAQLFQLALGLVLGFLRQFRAGDLFLKLVELVLTILAIAQLALNGLHLFVQVIFALRLFHLGFDARLDLFLDLQDGHFALHQPVNLFQPLGHVKRFEQLLLELDLKPQMARDEIGQLVGLAGFGHRGHRLFGDVLLDLGVAFEFLGDRAQKRLDRVAVALDLVQRLGLRFEETVVWHEFGDPHPGLALDQNLDRAIGQFQQLQHIGQHADAEDALMRGLVDRGVDLAGQQNLPVVGHHLLKRAHGFFPADEKRHDHVREHHDVTQRQDRMGGGECGHSLSLFAAKGTGPAIGNPSLPMTHI